MARDRLNLERGSLAGLLNAFRFQNSAAFGNILQPHTGTVSAPLKGSGEHTAPTLNWSPHSVLQPR